MVQAIGRAQTGNKRERVKSGPSRGPEGRVESKGSLFFRLGYSSKRALKNQRLGKAVTVNGRKRYQ
jgi:hypothetical protein